MGKLKEGTAKLFKDNNVMLYDAMRKVLGKTYDSEIFLHESCIMIDVMWELIIHRGCKVFPVYDGLYFDKEINNIEQIVERCALKYYKTVKESEMREEMCTSLSHIPNMYVSNYIPVPTISISTTLSNNCISIDSRKHLKLKRNKYFDELFIFFILTKQINNEGEYKCLFFV